MGTRVYIGGLPYRVKERDIERFFRGYGKLREVLIKNGYGFVEFEDYRDADDAVYELNGKELCGERVSVEHARGSGRRGNDRDRGYDRDRGHGHSGSNRRNWMDKVTVERAKGSPRARGRGPSAGRSPRNGRDYGRSGFRSPRQSGRGGDNPPPRYGPPTRTDYRLVVENLSSRVSWQDLKDYMRSAGEVTYADAHKQHRNEGVVEFATYTDLKTAIEKLDNTDLNGRRIKLVEDKSSRGSRRRSRSRSSSRSRSRSRRRSRSRSRSRSASKSRSRSKSRGRSKSKSKSRSRSPRKSRSKSRSSTRGDRSKSRDKSHDRDRSKSREKSVERDKRDSRDRDMSKSRSRSKSVVKSEPRSRSRSKSRSKSRDKSRSRSHSRSVSRSRSVSPRRDVKMENGDHSSPERDHLDD